MANFSLECLVGTFCTPQRLPHLAPLSSSLVSRVSHSLHLVRSSEADATAFTLNSFNLNHLRLTASGHPVVIDANIINRTNLSAQSKHFPNAHRFHCC